MFFMTHFFLINVLSRFLVSCKMIFFTSYGMSLCDGISEKIKQHTIRKFSKIFQNLKWVRNIFAFCKENINNVHFKFFWCTMHKMRGCINKDKEKGFNHFMSIRLIPFQEKTRGFNHFTPVRVRYINVFIYF